MKTTGRKSYWNWKSVWFIALANRECLQWSSLNLGQIKHTANSFSGSNTDLLHSIAKFQLHLVTVMQKLQRENWLNKISGLKKNVNNPGEARAALQKAMWLIYQLTYPSQRVMCRESHSAAWTFETSLFLWPLSEESCDILYILYIVQVCLVQQDVARWLKTLLSVTSLRRISNKA